MQIGVVGAGHVGGTLGRRWATVGHRVLFGVRDPKAPGVQQLLAQAGPNACAASVAEAAAYGSVVVFAVPWGAMREAVESAGDLQGKILVDVSNPMKRDLSGLDLPPDTSAAEMIASWAPGARVVKAFNTASYTAMEDPRFPEGNAAVFYAGDDAEARGVVGQLVADLAFQAVDSGPLVNARQLEAMGLLRIYLASVETGISGIAYRVLRR